MGTSALPGEQAWAAWPAPAGHPHLLKCCPLVAGGEPLDTRSTSKAVRGGAAKLRSRYSSARTHHGWEDGSDGPEAQAASVPAGPGDTRLVSSHWPPEVPAPQPEACPARPHLLSPSPPAARLSCCLGHLQPRPMPRPAPQPLGLWSFVAAAPGEYRLL